MQLRCITLGNHLSIVAAETRSSIPVKGRIDEEEIEE
jgi:hypothetical protein